jgi:ribonuclease PH
MAIRRGYSYMTVVVPTRVKTWVTRKARQESRGAGNLMSRSRLVERILEQAREADEVAEQRTATIHSGG